MLARALHGGQRLPWGTALLTQLRDALAPDQQAPLELALQGQPSTSSTPTIHLDLPEVEADDLAALRLLMRAIRQHQTISFEYQPSRKSTPTPHRGDEVLEVWFDAHAYVAIWCEQAQRELDLRLDRIVPDSLGIYPRTATPRQRRGERIRYWLAPEIAQGGVSVRLEAQEVRHQADGSAIVSGIARSRFWARRLLLSYGSNARALYPPTLVNEMRQVAQEMARLYEDTEREWEIKGEEKEER
jgi:predicted DNA-binding transcriptional regulator YafY